MKRSPMPARRTPLRSGSGLHTRTGLRATTRIEPVSRKRAKEQRTYTELRRTFLDGRGCEYPYCGQPASDVHHRRGRVGRLFLAVEHWSSLCREHHRHITEHPAVGYTLGLSEYRVSAP